MKKFLLLAFLILLINGCRNTVDETLYNIGQDFTIDYELISSSDLAPSKNPYPLIIYTNGLGKPEIAKNFHRGKKWSQTVKVSSVKRPFIITFHTKGLYLKSAGTVISNIYINNVKRASASNNTVAVPDYLVLINMHYQVN
jgi:hypothetical protein